MESIKITIGGDEYSFNSESSEIVLRSADILNANIEKLQELYGKNADYKRILVLAALNSISELYEGNDELEETIKQMENEIDSTKKVLSKVFEDEATK